MAPDTSVLEWRERLVCSQCSNRQADIVVIGTKQRRLTLYRACVRCACGLQTLVAYQKSSRSPNDLRRRYPDRGVAPPEAKNPAKSSGWVSKQRSPSGSVIHGCLLRVQICA